MTYLSYVFLLDASIFTTIDEKKEELKSTLQILLKNITKERKLRNSQTQLTLDNLNIPNIELLKIKLSHKPPLKQNYLLNKTCKKSHLITRTLIALKKFVFHPSNCLSLFGFELSRVNCSCPHFFSLTTYLASYI